MKINSYLDGRYKTCVCLYLKEGNTAINGTIIVIINHIKVSLLLVRAEQPPLACGNVGQSPWQPWLHREGLAPLAEVCGER